MKSLSLKQAEALAVVVRGNVDGSFVDLDELIERLSYKPSKAAAQFTVRALVDRNLIEKKGPEYRRAARRVTYAPTMKGYEENRSYRF